MCSGRLNSSRSTSDTRRVNLVITYVIDENKICISKSLDGYFLLLLLYIKRTTLHLSYYCNIGIAKWTFILLL